jgi:alkylated DNA repair protein alkB family protein 8
VERGLEVFAGDAVCLPLRSKSFDVALNIAVLHHISSEVRRRKLVTETMRLLTVNGVALFYAWALEQRDGGVSGHHFESQDVLVPFHKKAGVQGLVRVEERKESSGAAGEGKGAGEGERAGAGEGMAPEDPEAPKVYQRYCHVYKEGELETLFDHLGSWVRVNRVYFDCGNWCVEAERIA